MKILNSVKRTFWRDFWCGRSFRLFGPKVTNFCSIWSQRVGTFRPRSIAAIEASKLLLTAAAKPQKVFPDFSVFNFFLILAFLTIFWLFSRLTFWLSTESTTRSVQNVTKNWKIGKILPFCKFFGLYSLILDYFCYEKKFRKKFVKWQNVKSDLERMSRQFDVKNNKNSKFIFCPFFHIFH